MAVITTVEITSASISTNSNGANAVRLDVGVTTTSASEGDPVTFYVIAKRTNGNGELYDRVRFNSSFYQTTSGTVTFMFHIKYACDNLFIGGPNAYFSFGVSANGVSSLWYDNVYLSRSFSLPYDNFMIPERPAQQTQSVYYNGKYIGEAGCCVAVALAAAKEVQEIRSGRGVLQHSIGWFYGATSDGSGIDVPTGLNFLRDSGMALYRDVKTSHVQSYPDVYLYNDSSGYKGARSLYLENKSVRKALPQKIASWSKLSGQYGEPFGWQNIINAIQRTTGNNSSAVLADVSIDQAFDSVGSDGIMAENYGELRGKHFVLVLGWKTINGQQYFVCQNSWGANWGDNGIVYIPFYNVRHAYNDFYAGITDFYEIVDDPNAPDFGDVVFDWTYAGRDASGNLVKGIEKRAGYGIYITADEWNDLASLVSDETGATIPTVKSGTPISASVVNPMASALGVGTVSSGGAITASFFNGLRSAYNALE